MKLFDSRLPERFWSKVQPEPNGGCWLWTAAVKGNGYAVLGKGGGAKGMRYAHRVAYEALVGPIPDGLVIDHLCRVRCCVNPAHLEPVTNRENVIRGDLRLTKATARLARTRCAQGHEYSEVNTYLSSGGARRCRACQTLYYAKWKAKQPAQGV